MGSLPLNIMPFVDPVGEWSQMGADTGPPAPNFLTSSWDSVHNWVTGRNADTTGMSPTMAQTAQTGTAVRNMGLITSVLGGVSSAIGSFYAAKSAQYQEKSQASSYAFQADMAAINSSRAQITAQSIQEAGKNRIANYTMAEGQQKAGTTASMAARGIALGVGSTANVAASEDLTKDLNVLNINANTTRQAWAAREQGTNYANRSLIDRAGAANAMRSAGSISPFANTMTSLLGSATRVAGQWDYSRWLRMRLASGESIPQIGIG